jgi:hypothetical protein
MEWNIFKKNAEMKVGARVLHKDFSGPLVITELHASSATCAHEFLPVGMTPAISDLTLDPIQKPDISFMISSSNDDVPQIQTSNHFQNNYSSDCSTDFFAAIIDRALRYFVKYDYSLREINDFEQDIKALLLAREPSNLMDEYNRKYFARLPDYYQNTYTVIYSRKDELLTFAVHQYGDFFLQWAMLLITNELIGKMDTTSAIEIVDILYSRLREELGA